MFRANDEQVSINDELTREKFQIRVFHCLLNEISFVITLRFSLQPRLSSPRNINPDFPFILRIRHRFDIFFFFDTNSYESFHNSFGVFLHGEVRSREAFL